jgi:Lipocalin-like domain
MGEYLSRKHLLGFAASFGLFASLGNQSARAASSDGVVGAWTLVSFNVDEGKETERPRFGRDPAGYLRYTNDGHMAAVLAGRHRPALAPPSSIGAGAQGECAKAVGDFLAYAGSYEIRGDRVLHHVEVSVFTNLVGTTLERQFTIMGDTLTIRTLPPEIWGSSNVLVWKRA